MALSLQLGRRFDKDIAECSPKGHDPVIGPKVTAKSTVSAYRIAVERDMADQEVLECSQQRRHPKFGAFKIELNTASRPPSS